MSNSVQGKFDSWTITAANNLSNLVPSTGAIYKAVRNKTGDFAANGKEATGILQYGCDSGQYATVGYFGRMKATAGAAVTSADTLLTITASGYAIAATSGSWCVGKTCEAMTSGMIFTGLFNFITPVYLSV